MKGLVGTSGWTYEHWRGGVLSVRAVEKALARILYPTFSSRGSQRNFLPIFQRGDLYPLARPDSG